LISVRNRGTTALTIDTVEEAPAAVRVALEGQLDLTNVEQLNAELAAQERRAPRVLIVDLTNLRYVDSTGLASFIHLFNRLRETSTRLHFTHGPEALERIIQLSGLGQILQFED
jgi:anti-sigma B factor antagonist